MREAVKLISVSGVVLLIVILSMSYSFPVPELEAEIGLYPEWFPPATTAVSYQGGCYIVETDREVTEDNMEDIIMAVGFLVGCAARVMPEGDGILRLATPTLYFDISLDDCRKLYGMCGREDKKFDLWAYLQDAVIISER
jgi:hypothetical protein